VILFSAVVKLYVESAAPAEISAWVAAKATRGVVTSAATLADAAGAGGTAEDRLRAICAVANGPVFVALAASDPAAMLGEARAWAAVAANVIPTVPGTDTGAEVVRTCAAERIRTAMGSCPNLEPALAAARAGAVHVAVPVARVAGTDGYDVVRKLVALFRTYEVSTEVVACAIRIPTDIIDAALAGAHAVSAPVAVVRGLDAESSRMADTGRR